MLNYPRPVQVGGWEENLMQHSIRMAFVWKEKMCFIMEFCYFTLSLELIPNHIKYFCSKVTYAKSYPGSNLNITGFHRQPKTGALGTLVLFEQYYGIICFCLKNNLVLILHLTWSRVPVSLQNSFSADPSTTVDVLQHVEMFWWLNDWGRDRNMRKGVANLSRGPSLYP